ncbi:MAG TPA: helix-turn-helix domain-containing protein [Steroidobacteraceae bacterium]
MTQIVSFSTAGIEPRRKLACWNECASESFSPLVSDPADIHTFNGSIARTAIGGLTLADVYSDAQIVRHSRVHVTRTRSPLFFLHLQLEGESISRQDGREAHLIAGDFTICDSTRQYEIIFPESNRMLVLGIPEAQLRRQIASPECMVSIPMQASGGLRGLFSLFLRNYWVECRRDLDDSAAGRVTTAILELLGAAYAELPCSQARRSSLATAHRIRIISYIEAHLQDPDLSPTKIAAACKMTPRYLYHLSSGQDETIARYILRRRLEACARALRCDSQRGRTVTAIAFDHGFNSPTHFGRVFRAKFGMTPREYRGQSAARR